MNIYFCASIKGGRRLAAKYAKIIEMLKNHGVVLTEHIGYDKPQEKFFDEKQVYTQDTAWLRQSDIVVAEVTVPSLGVGYEIGLAQSLGKRIYCLYEKKEEPNISSMILGNEDICCFGYNDDKDLSDILDSIFLR